MPADTRAVQESALLPDSLFLDDFESFIADRVALLSAYALELIA